MSTTEISWTEAVWNPTTGCDKVSPGCGLPRFEGDDIGGCYAMAMAKRLKGMGQEKYQNDGDPRTSGPGFGVTMHPDALSVPLGWRKPKRIFVNSMSDLFHEGVSDDFIAHVFAIAVAAPQHTFQILTKRHARMRSLLSSPEHAERVAAHLAKLWKVPRVAPFRRPVPNVHLGVSTEDQEQADRRIPQLLNTPAAVRWISAEPLLGHIDLGAAALVPYEREQGGFWRYDARTGPLERPEGKMWVPAPPAQLDWVVVGGESGRGARPMRPGWARSLRDQCRRADVPFLFKQWGAHDVSGKRVGKGKAGRELNGRTHDEYPAAAS